MNVLILLPFLHLILNVSHYTDGLVLVYRAYVRGHAVGNNAGHSVCDGRIPDRVYFVG